MEVWGHIKLAWGSQYQKHLLQFPVPPTSRVLRKFATRGRFVTLWRSYYPCSAVPFCSAISACPLLGKPFCPSRCADLPAHVGLCPSPLWPGRGRENSRDPLACCQGRPRRAALRGKPLSSSLETLRGAAPARPRRRYLSFFAPARPEEPLAGGGRKRAPAPPSPPTTANGARHRPGPVSGRRGPFPQSCLYASPSSRRSDGVLTGHGGEAAAARDLRGTRAALSLLPAAMLAGWRMGGRRHGPSCAAAGAAGGGCRPGRRLGRGRPGGAQPAGELVAGQRERLGGAPRGGAGLRAHRPAPPRPHPGTVGSRAGTLPPDPPGPPPRLWPCLRRSGGVRQGGVVAPEEKACTHRAAPRCAACHRGMKPGPQATISRSMVRGNSFTAQNTALSRELPQLLQVVLALLLQQQGFVSFFSPDAKGLVAAVSSGGYLEVVRGRAVSHWAKNINASLCSAVCDSVVLTWNQGADTRYLQYHHSM